MERLTERYPTHVAVKCENCKKNLACNGIEDCHEVLRNSLAAYEDIGMTPEEITAMKNAFMGRELAKITEFDGVSIERMQELAKAEKEGRIVIAPSKTDETAEIVHCKDCKHMYFKDFEAFCPHRVGPCKPDGFCERGEKK